MFSPSECCGSSKVCGGVPGNAGPNAIQCGDCMSYKDGVCRGRDPKVPVQVSFGVFLLGLIFVGATLLW